MHFHSIDLRYLPPGRLSVRNGTGLHGRIGQLCHRPVPFARTGRPATSVQRQSGRFQRLSPSRRAPGGHGAAAGCRPGRGRGAAGGRFLACSVGALGGLGLDPGNTLSLSPSVSRRQGSGQLHRLLRRPDATAHCAGVGCVPDRVCVFPAFLHRLIRSAGGSGRRRSGSLVARGSGHGRRSGHRRDDCLVSSGQYTRWRQAPSSPAT
jgi:hypothetical protein